MHNKGCTYILHSALLDELMTCSYTLDELSNKLITIQVGMDIGLSRFFPLKLLIFSDLLIHKSLYRNLLPSCYKLLRVTHPQLLIQVLILRRQYILVSHHTGLLYSMDHPFLPMMFHFLGDQHIHTIMEVVFLVAVLIDHCIYLDQHPTLVDPWWEMVCSAFIIFCHSSQSCFLIWYVTLL